MEKITLFNPAYGSKNIGDFIISEACMEALKPILNNNFALTEGTHTPILMSYQLNTHYADFFEKSKYKFLLGSNIIKDNMLHRRNDWNVNIFNCKPYKNTILMASGLDGNFKSVNWYTEILYKKILSNEYYHSVRDEKTKVFLESLGFKAINTGCATLWSLTTEKCLEIATQKEENVVFTLTDYRRDKKNDQKLIDILKKCYKNVYFWVQGAYDYDYFKEFANTEGIKTISPTLEAYRTFLQNHKCDYIGTRLHAGIFAMRHNKRSIILAVDNRTRDMKETYNLNAIERNEIDKKLEDMINAKFETKIRINMENIEKWKSQFYGKK